MALDKFISSVRAEVAKRFDLKTDAEIDAFFIGMEESAKDNQEALEKRDKMLRDTVEELCEAKRLLKVAVEDLNVGHCIKNCETCMSELSPTRRGEGFVRRLVFKSPPEIRQPLFLQACPLRHYRIGMLNPQRYFFS